MEDLSPPQPRGLRAARRAGPPVSPERRFARGDRLPPDPNNAGPLIRPQASSDDVRLLGELRGVPRRAARYSLHRARDPRESRPRLLHIGVLAGEGAVRKTRCLLEWAGGRLRPLRGAARGWGA